MARRVGVVFGVAVLVLVVLAGVCSSAYAKDDLPADAKLRIGELDDQAPLARLYNDAKANQPPTTHARCEASP